MVLSWQNLDTVVVLEHSVALIWDALTALECLDCKGEKGD